MNRVFLSLGSNVGNRDSNLSKALKMVVSGNDSIKARSHVYETEPWGLQGQRNFLNQVVEMETSLEPEALLQKIHEVEARCGRIPALIRYSPRPLDIDILFFENRIINREDLKIPHPMIHLRRFVLVPLADIAAEFRHPVLGKTVGQLLSACDDKMKVVKV